MEWTKIQERRKNGEKVEMLNGPVILPSEVNNSLDCYDREFRMRINFTAG